jgi:translation initiation factor 3 subunit J
MKELESDESSEEEDEADRRARMRQMEQEADLRNAADLVGEDFGNIGISKNRTAKPVTVTEGDAADPSNAIDLSSMKLFKPDSLAEFNKLKEVLFSLVATQNSSKARYVGFAQDLVRGLLKDLPSDAIKKAASTITTLSNEKLKEEKAADKGGKKTKAAKTKTTLNASRDTGRGADVAAYDHDLDDDDFM